MEDPTLPPSPPGPLSDALLGAVDRNAATEHFDTGGAPARIGPYRILEQVGEGGFGAVYRAEQLEPVRREVAIKVLKRGMDTRAILTRFEAERQALALMDHPGIAKVLDAGRTADGLPFFVMELVRGQPITRYCDQHRLSTQERLTLFMDVCAAVQHAHHKGVIHRDLKPSNILVAAHEGRPTPKVIDFGIAKATRGVLTDRTLHTMQGAFLGTPEYMSPEQAGSNLDVDTRSDVYSLGVVLYELLTGLLPIDSERMRAAAAGDLPRLIRDAEPVKPSTRISSIASAARDASSSAAGDEALTPQGIARRRRTDARSLARQLRGDLDWITMRAMERDPSRRYDSPAALAADVQRHLDSQPVEAGPPSATYRMAKFARRHRAAVTVSVVMLVAMVAGLVVTVTLYRRAEVERSRAEEQSHEAQEQKRRAEQALASARAESAKLQVALNFVTGIFESVDVKQKGRNVTVREVIDETAGELDSLGSQPDVEAVARETVGGAYHALGQYDQAIRQLRRCLELRLQLSGPASAEALSARAKLGASLLSSGKIDEGAQLLQAAYDGRAALLGADDPVTIETLGLVAMARQLQGDMPLAMETVRRVIDSQTRTLGPRSRATLESRSSLVDMLHHNGQPSEADEASAALLKDCRDALGADDSLTLVAMSIRGSVLESLGRYDEAIAILEDCVKGKARVLGPDHPDLIVTRNILAMSMRRAGRVAEAIELQRQVLASAEKVFGAEAPATLSYMNNLAQALHTNKQFDEAGELYRRALEINRRVAGPSAVATLTVCNNYGLMLLDQGKPAEALPLLQETLSGLEAQMPEHWMTAASRGFVGNCLAELDRRDEAEKLMLASYEQLARIFGPEHDRAQRAAKALADAYRRWGRDDQAKAWGEKAAGR